MIYNNPPFAIVGRKSLGISNPKSLEGKSSARQPPTAPLHSGRYSYKRTGSTPRRLRSRMSASRSASRCWSRATSIAITGFSFSSYLNVKYGGVAQDDIVVMLLSDYGVKLYGNAIMVNPAFAAEKPEADQGLSFERFCGRSNTPPRTRMTRSTP